MGFATGSTFESLALALADVAVKGIFLFALSSIVALAMILCRASAAARHFVWLLTIVASLSIPLFGLLLPTWTIHLQSANTDQPPVLVSAEIPLVFTELNTANIQRNAPSINQLDSSVFDPSAAESKRGDYPVDPMPSEVVTNTIPQWQSIVVLTWAIGLAVTLLPVSIGSLSLWRLRRHCHQVTEKRLLSLLDELCEQLSIGRDVALVATNRRQIPMTWGVRRPIILLPAEATSWSSERVRAILLHELAHVQRWDYLIQFVAQLSRAVYWYNPLAWLAVQALRRDQEGACDDRVLQNGLLAADYAEHLLAVATSRTQHRFTPAVAMAMARSSRIERRLRSILDPSRRRDTLSRIRAWMTTAAAIGLLVPLATVSMNIETRAQEAAARKETADKQRPGQRSSSERFAELSRTLIDQYVTPPNEEQVLHGALKGMVEALNDPFSEFVPAQQLADLERQIDGKLTGIGAQLELREGQLTVVTPLEGSPALKAGIRPGDAILEIDTQPTRDLAMADAVKRIVGENGTKVVLKIRRASGENVDLNIERGPIVLRSVKGFARGSEHSWEFMFDREQKIGYVAVSQFGPGTPDELKKVITDLQKSGLNGLILDIRFSPGGLLQAAHEVAELFLGEATVVTIRGRDGKEQAMKSDGKKKLGDFPLVVLVNEQTASAAEVLAGALKDNKRALLVGTRTFGKGSVQSLIKLDNGIGAIRLTTSFYRSPSGRNIDRLPGEKEWGVDPSDGYFVPMTQEAIDQLNKRRLQREVIDVASREGKTGGELIPSVIEKEHGDGQLAAGLRTLTAKLVSGEFEKVGLSAEAAGLYAARRIEIQLRREALGRSLEQLDREWKSLDRDATAKPK
jgi:carboxyl-terminal processing protease